MPALATTSEALAEQLASIALTNARRSLPHVLQLAVAGLGVHVDPQRAHPAFHGCYDWHSAVHTHWALVRLAAASPEGAYVPASVALLDEHLCADKMDGELAFFMAPGRERFEVPYGLAWLLTLDMELAEFGHARAPQWRAAIAPLVALAADRMARWVMGARHPVRSGQHDQSALAMSLALDWARATAHTYLAGRLTEQALVFYGDDHAAALRFEPSAHDFVSPLLAEADLMRRVLAPLAWLRWLEGLLVGLDGPAQAAWLAPVQPLDPADGKLAHFCGLNLSRAWMLDAIAASLPSDHRWHARLSDAHEQHRRVGLRDAVGHDYAASHWLPSFATYLLTRRGLSGPAQGMPWPTSS